MGAGFATRDHPDRLIDAAIEQRQAVHVDGDIDEVDGLAAQQRNDALDGVVDIGRRPEFARIGKLLQQAAPGLDLARFRQLHANNAGVAPCDTASAHRRVEGCVSVPSHPEGDVSRRIETVIWNLER